MSTRDSLKRKWRVSGHMRATEMKRSETEGVREGGR